MLPKRAAIQHYWPASSSAHIAGRRCRPFCINILPFSLHGFPAPFRRRFPALPLGGHRRVSHADGHAVFKVQQAKRKQKSRHRTDQPCLRFFWKVMLVGYVTAERICKNMLYSIVGIDYHKNRAVSTKSFENTLISAGCKKRQGKLWQKKERAGRRLSS